MKNRKKTYWILFLIIVSGLILIITSNLSSCETGYVKVNNHWSYITINEGNGKTVFPLYAEDNSFQILESDSYAKDKDKVYFEREVIKSADSKTFRILGDSYSCDKNHVFVDSLIVIGANPKTFQIIKFPYSKDDKKIYCGTIPMNIKDKRNFKIVDFGNLTGTTSIDFFIKDYPEYSYIDTLKILHVAYCSDGIVITKTEKFIGLRPAHK